MRRQLTTVAGALVGLLLVALMVPLVNAYAEDRTQDAFVARLSDVSRFAVLAQGALEGGGSRTLTTDLERYVEVYGGTAVVTNANHEVVASSGPEVSVTEPELAAAIQQALSGSVSPQPSTLWPWADSAFVVSSPVGRDAQVLGAVVMIAPTDSIRDSVGTRLAWLVVAGLAILLTAFGLVGRFVAWILRPVLNLDGAALRMAHGDLATRVPATTGPPELQHLARSFNQMADHVQTSQQQQRDLIADASHQLGNPLTALRLRVENLRTSAPEPTEAELALEETDRLNSIVDSLLDLSQVGAHQVSTEPVDVAELVRHRCEMWHPVIPELKVEAPSSAQAFATPHIVDLVLDALLDNAAKFAEGSAVEATVDCMDDRVVLTVRDHGPGLCEDDLAKVGARFFRGREHQNIAGTGLGLAIVRARVKGIGGTLSVSRPADGGLAVQVILERVTPAAP